MSHSLELWALSPPLNDETLPGILRANAQLKVFSAPCVSATRSDFVREARANPHEPRNHPSSRNAVTSVAPFSSLAQLRELYLPNNGVTVGGLAALATAAWLPSLSHLWLCVCKQPLQIKRDELPLWQPPCSLRTLF